jgi:VanZ family protein
VIKRWHAALVVVVLLLFIVVFVPISTGHSRLLGTFHDFAHTPIFACIAALLVLASRRIPRLAQHPRYQYLLALAGAAAFGLLTEVAQMFTGRDASWSDVRRDVIGALVGLALLATRDRALALSSRTRVWAMLFVMVLLSIALYQVGWVSAAYVRRAIAFPVLADYDRRFDRVLVVPHDVHVEHVPLPDPWAHRAGEAAMRVSFKNGHWSAFEIHEPPRNWLKQTTLALDITNATNEPAQLVLVIRDAQNSGRPDAGFLRVLSIAAQTRSVERIALADVSAAPQGRPMRMDRIKDFFLFREQTSTVPAIYVSRVWLE